MQQKVLAGLAGIALVGVLAGCTDKYQEPFKDGPRNGTDKGAAKIVEMPDGFSNVAYKCLTGTHVLMAVAYHGDNKYASISTVVDPQDCP